jgi:diphosphomevalonate decarboxylase
VHAVRPSGSSTAVCTASPSLALVKYWGKAAGGSENRPATASLAVTLGGLVTRTRATLAERDSVSVDGRLQDLGRFAPFFTRLRRRLGVELHFRAESANEFPSAAGLASSSSGFAALAVACSRAAGAQLSAPELSELARSGSASAARSLFGGFTLLPAGAGRAMPLFGPEHWPELRVVVSIVTEEPKAFSSRQAMELTRRSSPYYRSWLRDSERLLPRALAALEGRDLEQLGEAMRLSYTRMHAALLASEPPVLYWLPATVALMRECALLRLEGTAAWETLDAGPQVKVLCLASDAEAIAARLRGLLPGLKTLIAWPGQGPACAVEEGRGA